MNTERLYALLEQRRGLLRKLMNKAASYEALRVTLKKYRDEVRGDARWMADLILRLMDEADRIDAAKENEQP
jgi:hypothetical protein